MTIEELEQQLSEEQSRVAALKEEIKKNETKIAELEKENGDFKLENSKLRTTNGQLLLKIDNTKVEPTKEEEPKSLEELVLDIYNKEEK